MRLLLLAAALVGLVFAGSRASQTVEASAARPALASSTSNCPDAELLTGFEDGPGSLSPSGGCYGVDDIVTVTATPDPGYELVQWLACSGNPQGNQCTIFFGEPRIYYAVAQFGFIPTPPPTPQPIPPTPQPTPPTPQPTPPTVVPPTPAGVFTPPAPPPPPTPPAPPPPPPPPAPPKYGSVGLAKIGRIPNGLQAIFSFALLPVRGSQIKVGWYYNNKRVAGSAKSRTRLISSSVLAAAGLPHGFWRSVLSVRVPNGRWKPVKEAHVRI